MSAPVTPVTAPVTTRNIEDVFDAEAVLRESARDLDQWEAAGNRTPAIINQKRKALRLAARVYARIATRFEAP